LKEVFSLKNQFTSLQSHMMMLCNTIGARPTGSEKNKAAVDYTLGVFQNCGFQTSKQEFDCMDWHNFGAELVIDGQNISAESAEYSLSCDAEADFVCIDTVQSLQNSVLSGKIAILYGDLCKEPLMPKNFEFYNPDEHKQIIALLEEKNPIAIITVISNNEHIIQDGDFNIPCAVVSGNTLDVFMKNAEKKIKLTINTKRIPTKAHNVIATYGKGNQTVCFSAHIDTKPITPGALDNASGVSVLLALAETLPQKDYPFKIEIVLLNGEDYYSTPGEVTYMGGLSSDYNMTVNVDGVGLKGSATSISFYECPKHLETKIMEYAKTANNIERIEPWPMGDHMMFVMYGVPTIAMTAGNIFNLLGTITHSPNDNMENIDFDILDDVVRFLLRCIE
jgi:aminopeptidase YwaD